MSDHASRFNVWLLTVIVIGMCAVIVVSLRGGGSKTEAGTNELRSELDRLQNLIDAQSRPLVEIEGALDQQRLAAGAAMFGEGGAHPTGTVGPQVAALADLIATSAEVQSNTLVLVRRLMERAPPQAAPQLTLQQSRVAYDLLQEKTEQELGRLDGLKQQTADLMFQLRLPDDIAVMDAERSLDTPSLSQYWAYFEAKRRRDAVQRMTDAMEMKLVQEKMNMNTEEARAGDGR